MPINFESDSKVTASEDKPAIGDCGEPFARTPGDGRRLILAAFTFALPFGLTICAAVAARAVFDVCNSFCAVLGNDARLLVLMAAVTAVTSYRTCCVFGQVRRSGCDRTWLVSSQKADDRLSKPMPVPDANHRVAERGKIDSFSVHLPSEAHGQT